MAAISAFQKGLLSQLSTCMQQWLTGIVNWAGMLVRGDNSAVYSLHYLSLIFSKFQWDRVNTVIWTTSRGVGWGLATYFFFRSFGTLHYQRILIRTKSYETVVKVTLYVNQNYFPLAIFISLYFWGGRANRWGSWLNTDLKCWLLSHWNHLL